jgi:hypothetical protein
MMDKYIDLLIKESLKKLAEPKKGKKNKKPEESKEATATGGGYAFSSPAFSMWSEDDVAKSEYKKSEPIEGEFTQASCARRRLGSISSIVLPASVKLITSL